MRHVAPLQREALPSTSWKLLTMAVAKLHAAAIREGRVYAQFHIRGCAFVFTFETYEGPGNVRWWSVGVERGERGWSQLDEHLQPGQLDSLEDCLDLVAAWLRDSHRLAYVTGTDVAAGYRWLVEEERATGGDGAGYSSGVSK